MIAKKTIFHLYLIRLKPLDDIFGAGGKEGRAKGLYCGKNSTQEGFPSGLKDRINGIWLSQAWFEIVLD